MQKVLKIATLNFNFGWLAGERSLHRWADILKTKYCECNVNHEQSKTYKGDVIIGFNGRPEYAYPNHIPAKEFKGLKIVHLQDYQFNTKRVAKLLKEHNINIVLGYASHNKLDPYFQSIFTGVQVIPVPFGFDYRFKHTKPFSQRINKCVGLGAINLVDEGIPDLLDYKTYFVGHKYSHPWRNLLRENKEVLKNELDSYFPEYPQTKKFDYDIVETYNNYRMSITCDSLCHYPSVKTYEAMACGSVFIATDNPCYNEIGLINGVNCLKCEDMNINSFKEIVNFYQKYPDLLEKISNNGQEFIKKEYNPEKIADDLYQQILKIA